MDDVTCESDFPSSNPKDADSIKRFKSWLDDASVVECSRSSDKAGYDYFFMLKDFSMSMSNRLS